MKLLLDTHLLLWAAYTPERLPDAVRAAISAPENELFFSAASLWEIVIKRSLEKPDFLVDASVLQRGMVENGYQELSVSSRHAVAVGMLPPLHKDPFDRLLIAQAITEGITLWTADLAIGQYSGPIRVV